MDDTIRKRAKQIFQEALERSGPERDGFIAAACGEDERLRAKVKALLEAHDKAGEFLASPTIAKADEAARAAAAPGSTPLTEGPGSTIGPYKLLQVIGEGGFGVVYMAEQEEPVRRQVALKIIKLGMDTRQVIARFEAERQALALMEHPNIARVLDAGATETGRPYFVMELVRGVPIVEYCDSNRLSTDERLDLFREVCAAVHHAHQKGIIHRDIKPSNVMVTLHDGKPVPKVIDFGIAKATGRRLTEKTLFTEYGQFVGTPVYMSPEQAEMSGLDVDTRSDIYSLGVLLYELLTGTTPFDIEALRAAGYGEMQRIIREEEPPTPSARLSTLGGALTDIAEHRKTDPGALTRSVRGDLDWIVMRALEKERKRRYGSASDLSDDIRRHLMHEPVQAGPPGVAYKMKKFIRRHRVGVGAVAVVFVALVAGLAAAGYGLLEARRANERTREEATTAKQVSEFLVGLFEVSDPNKARGREITVREVLDRGAERIDVELQDQPQIQQRLRHTMGGVYMNLGLYDDAERLLEQALEGRREGEREPDAEMLKNMIELAGLYDLQNRESEAEPLYEEAIETGKRVLGPHHELTLRAMALLGGLYRVQGRYEEAEAQLVRTLEALRLHLGDEYVMTHSTMVGLAMLYTAQGRHEEAEPLYREALELARRTLGEDHPVAANENLGLVWLYRRMGRYDEAEPLCVEALEAARRILGEDHPRTLRWMLMLGGLYRRQGRYEEAEPLLVNALEASNRRLGENHDITLDSNLVLAELRRDQRRYAEAEALARESLTRSRRKVGEEQSTIPWALRVLVDIYLAQGREDEARPLARELLAARRDAAMRPDADAEAKNGYAWPLLTWEPADLRDPQTALAIALEANELSGFENPEYLDTLALAYYMTGDELKAVETQRKAISLLPDGDRRRSEFEERLARYSAGKP